MKIYRVEHQIDGTGPFRREGNRLNQMFQSKLRTHPAPHSDGFRNFHSGTDHIGCDSMEQLRHWFSDVRDVLKELGMVVRVFEVPHDHIKYGHTQVAFCRNPDCIIEERSIDCLA